jgi:hypothetical protein
MSMPSLISACFLVKNSSPQQIIWEKPAGCYNINPGKNYIVTTENIFVIKFGSQDDQIWNTGAYVIFLFK